MEHQLCFSKEHYWSLVDGFQDNHIRKIRKMTCQYFSNQRLAPSFYEFSSGKYLRMEFKSGSQVPSGYGFSANYTFQSLGK